MSSKVTSIFSKEEGIRTKEEEKNDTRHDYITGNNNFVTIDGDSFGSPLSSLKMVRIGPKINSVVIIWIQ